MGLSLNVCPNIGNLPQFKAIEWEDEALIHCDCFSRTIFQTKISYEEKPHILEYIWIVYQQLNIFEELLWFCLAVYSSIDLVK